MATKHDTHGLTEGARVLEDGAEVEVRGRIVSIDDDAGTCWVRWDNGHDAFDVDIDVLIPVGGW